MSVPTISQVLTALVAEAARASGYEGALDEVEPALPTQHPRFGDYQSNHAFRLGRVLRCNPRQVAERIKAALPAHPAVAKTEVAGPGFLNFTLDDDWLLEHLAAQVEDEHRGLVQSGRGRTVVIDYSSPNVAKRMHVGHMRSTIIGNALHRLYASAGWNVVADNHIGDWGTQFGKLIVAWRRWLDPSAFEADPIGELERLYVRFGEEAARDPTLDDLARAETAKLQAGDPDNRALWKRFIEISMTEFDAVYERLDVSFTVTHGESFYHDRLAGVVDRLVALGIARQSEGAVIVKFPDDAPDKALSGTVLVIRKSDGAFLYGTTDLATLKYRLDTWHPDRVVYVTDTRQQLHFKHVFATWRAWRAAEGEDPDAMELHHTSFGMLKLPEGAMSTRKGNVIRLVDLLDEAVRRARAVVDEKSPELSDEERARVAEAVGTGAIRYADLSQNPQSDVIFDWDRMLSLDGNTAPFLMYSFARCRSVQRKGGGEEPDVAALVGGSMAPVERELVLGLLRLPEVASAALDTHRPNLLCDHLFETANTFNRFWYEKPILGAGDAGTRAFRLALVEATARVLQVGLDLLGIRALDRM